VIGVTRKETAPSAPGETTRRAFSGAAGPVEPNLSRLIDRVPGILAEAEHRREARAQLDPLAAVLPLARKALPRLAAATAVLLVVALVIGNGQAEDALDTQASLDRYILTGELGDGVSDLLLKVVDYEADDDG
jgi:hypothetical protein